MNLDRLLAEREIERMIVDYAAASDAGEWGRVAAMYAEEGRMNRPTAPDVFVEGRAAILAAFEARPARSRVISSPISRSMSQEMKPRQPARSCCSPPPGSRRWSEATRTGWSARPRAGGSSSGAAAWTSRSERGWRIRHRPDRLSGADQQDQPPLLGVQYRPVRTPRDGHPQRAARRARVFLSVRAEEGPKSQIEGPSRSTARALRDASACGFASSGRNGRERFCRSGEGIRRTSRPRRASRCWRAAGRRPARSGHRMRRAGRHCRIPNRCS